MSVVVVVAAAFLFIVIVFTSLRITVFLLFLFRSVPSFVVSASDFLFKHNQPLVGCCQLLLSSIYRGPGVFRQTLAFGPSALPTCWGWLAPWSLKGDDRNQCRCARRRCCDVTQTHKPKRLVDGLFVEPCRFTLMYFSALPFYT